MLANSRFSQREERACNRADALLFNKIECLKKKNFLIRNSTNVLFYREEGQLSE
ncbi:hypothetical protein N175_17465 [Vibrio anguillarum M3]|nr:hypothetical protein N175_17465 [Vibrio anguillarum M3]